MSDKVLMTLKGRESIEKELEHLVKVEREEIKKAIAEAREHGDLKENAEYHSAKEKQSHIEGRIQELQGKIALSEVIDPSKTESNKILFGATVSLLNVETDEEVRYQIVGEDEANAHSDKISYNSPLAKALLGKEDGEEVTVRAPKGDIEYEVTSVEYI